MENKSMRSSLSTTSNLTKENDILLYNIEPSFCLQVKEESWNTYPKET